jgi:hypothetical protein
MRDIVNLLLHCLSRKGLMPLDVKKLIKDVLYVLNDGVEMRPQVVNQRLEDLGWNEKILDEYTLDLILCLLFDIAKCNVRLYAEESDGGFYQA